MTKFAIPIPLSLYIHLPWCVKKCPYCDFNSHEAGQVIPEEAYIGALLRDLDEAIPCIEGRRFSSLFFGGGTPSLFSPRSIGKLLDAIDTRLPFSSDLEITLEANPGTLDEARFVGFKEAGVNRISLGIQSLQDEKLKQLGRIHNRDCALRAIDAAYQAGFTRINLDLMHGLPGQSVEDALDDLENALQFKPSHLSWYQLTIEPNTFFHHQPPVLPQEEMLWDIQEQGKTRLLQSGLQQYEVSAYATPGFECKHNQNYWEFGDYLGIGAGAYSKITSREDQCIRRHSQVKHPKEYLTRTTLPEKMSLKESDIIFEFMLNALRLTNGVKMSLLTERTGLDAVVLEPQLTKAKKDGLLLNDSTLLKPTELGQRFLNNLISLFL